jgi:2-C-methyl-D-erythritol 4-phosphate cytidylyltransferase
MSEVAAIIVAAGRGKRFGSAKQFAILKGLPLVYWSLERFEKHPEVDRIVLVIPPQEEKETFLRRYKKLQAVVPGGTERQDSVGQGFEQIDPSRTGIVLVHDGVRPLLSEGLITRVIHAARDKGAAVPGVALDETIREARGEDVIKTHDRNSLYRIQTPQGFSYALLKEALESAVRDKFYGTDEAMLLERLGMRVVLVEGDPKNIKITNPSDLKVAEALLET